jgi:hypothetical protein
MGITIFYYYHDNTAPNLELPGSSSLLATPPTEL